jgi:hypothetical protein
MRRTTRKLSEATKRKISQSMTGSRNPNFAKSLSADHKYKISRSMIAYWKSVKKEVTDLA